jgi:hypothetical protein
MICVCFCLVERTNNFVAHRWWRDVARPFVIFLLSFCAVWKKKKPEMLSNEEDGIWCQRASFFLFRGTRFRLSYPHTFLTSVIRWWNHHFFPPSRNRWIRTSLLQVYVALYLQICTSRLKYNRITKHFGLQLVQMRIVQTSFHNLKKKSTFQKA